MLLSRCVILVVHAVRRVDTLVSVGQQALHGRNSMLASARSVRALTVHPRQREWLTAASIAKCACSCAGGPDRWRVICCAAGGRHNLVLAMPDNSDSDRAARSHSNTVRCWPELLMRLLCSSYLLGTIMKLHATRCH